MADDSVVSVLEPLRSDLVYLIHSQLAEFQPRDCYQKLLHLGLIFLGSETEGIQIIAPGAFHIARWMTKLIYCLNIYLFRSQFHLTARELAGLQQFNIFVMQMYLKAWYTCQCATSASQNDLKLLKELVAYEIINISVAKAAVKIFPGHVWYLSETLIGLAFF